MTKQFSIMQYNQRFLVIRNAPDKNPLVIAECYFPEIAEIICTLLTDAAQDKNYETEKSEGF